ncbi:MAG: ABC transporter ATP-binding protein, partial [Planctomycetota bacterium]
YVLGLIGPNGAGKTTLLKLILNLVSRDAGTIRVLGLDNIEDEIAMKRKIGFVFDETCFFGDGTLDRYRRAVAPFYPDWNDALFERLLEDFALPSRKKYKTLSHGMKTKFALALALSHGAELLILDEPTSGLDPVFRRDLLDRLADVLQDERRSVIFSTHIVTDLERIADYVAFIQKGRLVFCLPQDELIETWGIVKGGDEIVEAVPSELRRGLRRGTYGVELLTCDAAAARESVGQGAIVERASLEDIMVLMGGESHAA